MPCYELNFAPCESRQEDDFPFDIYYVSGLDILNAVLYGIIRILTDDDLLWGGFYI